MDNSYSMTETNINRILPLNPVNISLVKSSGSTYYDEIYREICTDINMHKIKEKIEKFMHKFIMRSMDLILTWNQWNSIDISEFSFVIYMRTTKSAKMRKSLIS